MASTPKPITLKPSPSKVWVSALVLISLLALSLGLAWASSRFQSLEGWLSFLVALLLGTGLLVGVWRLLRDERLPNGLSLLMMGAILLRLAAGVLWFLALPIWGHGTPAEQAGYVMGDAYARDQAAWRLARSDEALWTAFLDQRRVDQYGGVLFLSALVYRHLGSESHQPLLIIVFTAVFSGLGVLFTWALVRHAWGEKAAWLAAWILAIYPEAVLLGSSQMREALAITLTVTAFYGLLRYRHDRSWKGVAWILVPMIFYLPLSPPFAAILMGSLALAAVMTSGILARDLLRQRKLWLIFGALFVLVLGGLWLALRQFTPEGMYNPLEMLSWYLKKSAQYQAYLSEHASGWWQKVFEITPEWTHLPMLLAYGVLQPFLPAAMIVGSRAPIWPWINLWRSIGWTILLGFLVYAPFRAWRQKGDPGFARALVLIIWFVILVTSFRGGADMWDNPRYRATYAGLQAALVAWVWIEQRRASDPWLRRALLGLAAILFWFIPWYLQRYTAFEWPAYGLSETLMLGIVSAVLLVVGDWLREKVTLSKDPQMRKRMILQIAASGAVIYIVARALLEFYHNRPELWLWLGKFSVQWWFIIGGLGALYALCLFIPLGILWFPGKAARLGRSITAYRQRAGWLRGLLAAVIALLPTCLLLYTNLGSIFTGPYLRTLLLVSAGSLTAVCIASGESLVQRKHIFFGFTLVSSLYLCGSYLTSLTNYPFSLTWSEGNRLYDYSVFLGSQRYITTENLTENYGAPGRYLLWGILFAIPDTPIWLHRLWNAILSTAPYILLGYLLARWSAFQRLEKWTFALWIFLFLTQGPIYTPLLLSVIVVVLSVRPKRVTISIIGALIAGYYASASRWTWVAAAAAWAALILIAEFEIDRAAKWQKNVLRLAPIAIVTVAGLIGGLLANPKILFPQRLASGTAFSQPLLWYRLLPNATYTQGILLGLAIATGPLIALLIWLALTRRWRLNWLQLLAYVTVSIGFLAAGLTASVKIGGGNNLHNLDMFFATLALISGLVLRGKEASFTKGWPWLAGGLLALAILLPGWSVIRQGQPLQLPPREKVSEALQLTTKKVKNAQRNGEVLFLDQRQLLTFGYIEDVELVSEYEKKYMMDQAMAGNEPYFHAFYQDLADKRFTMIVTEPLFTNIQDPSYGFQEENNAWVDWIAEPLLCYYAPVNTFPEARLQLLVPRADTSGCPR